ncbi:MAG: DUF1579 domain-containing protein [Planctomycetota bacterium]
MRSNRLVRPAAVALAGGLTFGAGYAVSSLQDSGMKPAQGDEMKFEVPKPGPEHAELAKSVGTWDAEIESMMGGPPSKSKGIETVKAGPGGLWVLGDIQSEFMGMPFAGHSVTGYDTSKGKYVGAWVDSMGTYLTTMEGTFDGKTRTGTFFMEMPDPSSGKAVTHRMVEKWTDDDNRTLEMYAPGPDGKEGMGMRIAYKRRK